jgi:hypothetical protein
VLLQPMGGGSRAWDLEGLTMVLNSGRVARRRGMERLSQPYSSSQEYMRLLEKEKELEGYKGQWEKLPLWRRVLVRAFDPKRIVNFQHVSYGLIILNGAFRMYTLWATVRSRPRTNHPDARLLGKAHGGLFLLVECEIVPCALHAECGVVCTRTVAQQGAVGRGGPAVVTGR